MGLIRRSYTYLDITCFLMLYKALVRPHLEYANQVWAPRLKKYVVALENVQRRATKQIPGFKDMEYRDRLEKLSLPTLVYRRLRGDMIELFKILSAKYDKRVCDFIPLHEGPTRGHPLKIKKEHIKLNKRSASFVPRSVNVWNSLPCDVVTAPSIQAFERRLDRHWRNEPFRFNFEAQPPGTTTAARHRSAVSHDQDTDTDLTPEAI